MTSCAASKTISKALDISSATARVDPDLLKALAILSDITAKRSAVNQEDLLTILEIRKKWSRILLFTSFFKDFTNHR